MGIATNFRRFLIVFFLLGFVFIADARRKEYLRLSGYESIDAEGLKFRCFKYAKPNPLPVASIVPLEEGWENKKNVRKVDAYIPQEVWKRDQYVGRWVNKLASVTVYKASLPAPEGFNLILDKYVLKKDYDAWKASAPKTWDKESILKWMEYFCDKKVDPNPSSVKTKSGKCDVFRYFPREKKGFEEIFYVVDPKNPWRRYIFHYLGEQDSIDSEKSLKAVYASIKSVAMFAPQEAESQQLTTKKSIKKGNKSKEYLASLETVKSNIKNLDNWWYIETENYILASNVRNKKLINYMQVHIERCRGIYETFFPLKGAVKEISVVKIFQERNEYVDYIGKEWGDTTRGLWVVFKKELAVSPLTNAKSKISRSAILETLYHEGFHQYIFYASNCLTPSAWFNEGHAAFFEGFDFKNRGSYDIEPSDRRLKTFPKGITPESLQSLLNMSYDDFYSPVNVSRNYSTAWALIYFIRKGAPLMKKFNYCRIPDKYYDSFCELGNDEEATKKAWEGIDMKQFVDDFNGFWASKRLFRKSKSLDMDKVLNYLRKSSK